MSVFEVVLVEWPEGRQAGGPRVLGQVAQPEIVARVREIVATAHRKELARLSPPVREVENAAPADRKYTSPVSPAFNNLPSGSRTCTSRPGRGLPTDPGCINQSWESMLTPPPSVPP